MRRFFCLFVSVFVLGLSLLGCDSGTGVPGDLGENTAVSFTTSSDSVGEGEGTYTLDLEVRDPGHQAFSVNVSVDEQSTAALGDDLTGVPDDTTLSFPESTTNGATRSLSLQIVDDVLQEGDKELVLSLSVAEGADVSIGDAGTFALTIQDNDLLGVDFSDGELAPMSAYSVASNADWEVSSEGDPPNAPYAMANGFGADEPSNDWLITPPFNFTDYEDETLTFLNAKGFDDSGQRGLKVKVSTDYDGEGNPENFSWTDVSDQVTFSEGDFAFVESGEVDLSAEAFQGDEVYVAFQYQSTGPTDAATWEVDDIVVVGTPTN